VWHLEKALADGLCGERLILAGDEIVGAVKEIGKAYKVDKNVKSPRLQW
jgi:hypothetical protein